MTTLHATRPRHARPVAPMRIAMLGTRGVPAACDGFETAVEEIGRRLVAQGHEVTVYGRSSRQHAPRTHLGMRLVTLPALRSEALGSLSHTALSAAHCSAARRHDVVFVFNAVNAPFVPLLRSRGTAVAVHVDGLEWKRDRWGRVGRRYHRMAEQFAVREADALIAHSRAIADYYDDEFGIPAEVIRSGSTILTHTPRDGIQALGLTPGRFHLVVARFERDDHLDAILEGYHRSDATLPLVVVGSPPNPAVDTAAGTEIAARDPRIRMLGAVRDQRLLDQLYAHAISYLHGHSVGGANPSLLRAMGAGTAVIGWDVVFNREVTGTAGSYFSSPAEVTRSIEEVERYPARFRDIGELMQERTARRYDWDSATEAYEALAAKLTRGYSTRGMSTGRRIAPAWAS
ncbi:MAG: glycosyltransferase family 1 protein, partial [Acidobacteria bacterium]|nr:glycosyltransferase family 1 protein [Acidobacteriota bacterium]